MSQCKKKIKTLRISMVLYIQTYHELNLDKRYKYDRLLEVAPILLFFITGHHRSPSVSIVK